MAQHKYDMLTVHTAQDAPKRHHPWYKERLKLKFINRSKQAASLNGQKWTFVANDIDDFRTGVPCKIKGQHMVKHGRSPSFPLVRELSAAHSQKPQHPEPKLISNNPGRRTLYSKVGPRKQVQLERLNRDKQALLKHPFQLFPHLEDSISIELLDGVLGVIDPELKADAPSLQASSSTTSSLSSISSHTQEDTKKLSDPFVSSGGTRQPPKPQQSPKPSNLYKFPLKKTKEEKEREKMMVASQQVISASQQSRVDQVTHDLVQWMKALEDGEDDDDGIDESQIKNLFSSDYESRPTQMVPIHVVELVNVPIELRLESGDQSHSGYSSNPSLRYASANQHQYGRTRMRGLTFPNIEQEKPRYVRSKYGAWYLPVDLWKLRNENQPLQDPKEQTGEADGEEAMKRIAMDKVLSELHGARSFKEFIVTKKKGSTVPTFLGGVDISSQR